MPKHQTRRKFARLGFAAPDGVVKKNLLRHSPGGKVRPAHQLLRRPAIGLALVASGTSVWNLVSLARRGRDKAKGVAADVHIGNSLRDGRHMARDTFAAGAPGLVMRVLFQGSRRSVG